MAAGVGVLRAKRRAEGVRLAQGQAIRLHVELPGDGKKRLAAEEVGMFGRCHAKEIAGPLAVGAGDDRRVDPHEAAAVEVAMHGLGDAAAHPGDGTEGIGARAQVGHRAQLLETVPLFGDGIGCRIRHVADHAKGCRLELEGLAAARGFDHRARCGHRAAGAEAKHLVIVRQGVVRHYLQIGHARTVAQGHERKAAFGGTPGFHPALYAHFAAGRHVASQHLADGCLRYRDCIRHVRSSIFVVATALAALAPFRNGEWRRSTALMSSAT